MQSNNFQSLDVLQIMSFLIQLKNIEWDENQNMYIHSVIENINSQIAKLHQENDIIMKQNEQILQKLDRL